MLCGGKLEKIDFWQSLLFFFPGWTETYYMLLMSMYILCLASVKCSPSCPDLRCFYFPSYLRVTLFSHVSLILHFLRNTSKSPPIFRKQNQYVTSWYTQIYIISYLHISISFLPLSYRKISVRVQVITLFMNPTASFSPSCSISSLQFPKPLTRATFLLRWLSEVGLILVLLLHVVTLLQAP